MSERAIDDLTALLPRLLDCLDALAHIARRFDPLAFEALLASVGEPDAALRAARQDLGEWPAHLAGLRARIETASDATLQAFDELRGAGGATDDLRAFLRALKHPPRALDALYPLARGLPPVSRFFLEPEARGDAAIEARVDGARASDDLGVFHSGERRGARGGFSIYVPEYYTPDRAWPVVMALHGGSGDGFSFLWSWLPAARAHGAIVIAPSSIGRTWALAGEDVDSPNIARILAHVRDSWNVDPARMLLTGMSDGGTFCYVSGLETASPFTHLAPVSAAFIPLLAQMADPDRMAGLPIRITHGVHDWMFPVGVAREAQRALKAAGANVACREIADLGHSYPREENADILRWLETSS